MPRDLPANLADPAIATTLTKHTIPLSTWMAANPSYDRLATGAFILRLSPTKDTNTKTTQLLLLKRASTDSYPNVWEPPGGSVDPEDLTIIHAIVRETWEETGLRVTSVKRQIWHGDGDGKEEVSFLGKRGEKWCKLNYVVEVESKEDGELDVQLDVLEHQDWGWFTREEMEKLEFVGMKGRQIARNAYKAFEEGLKL